MTRSSKHNSSESGTSTDQPEITNHTVDKKHLDELFTEDTSRQDTFAKNLSKRLANYSKIKLKQKTHLSIFHSQNSLKKELMT